MYVFRYIEKAYGPDTIPSASVSRHGAEILLIGSNSVKGVRICLLIGSELLKSKAFINCR